MVDFKIELMVAKACVINSHWIEGMDHLPSLFDVGQSRRREAIPWEQSDSLGVVLAQLIDFGLEIADSHGASFGLDIIYIVKMDDS